MAYIYGIAYILNLACFATSLSSAYQCHQFSSIGGSATTCEATEYGCQISNVGDMIVKKCASEAEPCVIKAAKSQGVTSVTYCCTDNLCNDDSPAFENFTNQCYLAQCTGEGCITEAINNGPVTICPRTEFGCSVRTHVTSHGTSMSAHCVHTTCQDSTVEGESDSYSFSCCNSDFCNDGVPDIPSQNDDVCYQFTCIKDNCVENAVATGTTGFCPRTANGCTFSSATTANDNGLKSYVQSAYCSPTVCEGSSSQLHDGTIINYCCSTSRCNNGDMGTGQQLSDQCYSNVCDSKDCLDKAINDNTAVTCTMDPAYGCHFSSITTVNDDGTKSYLQTASCAPGVCGGSSLQSNNRTIINSCCSTSRCNNGDMGTGQPEDDQCYSNVCDGKDCLDKAINDNTAATCTMDPAYGCAFSSVTTPNDDGTKSYHQSAICAPSVCEGSSLQSNNRTIIIYCCSTSRCNNGDMGAGQPVHDQCYSAVCHGKDCLDKAIKDNTAATCAMNPAYGCATITTLGDNITTTATCLTESTPCITLEIAESESRKVCCKTDKCNTEAYFTSDSTTIHLPNPLVMLTSSIFMMICLIGYNRTE